jgi:hypothetical protein
MLIVFQGRLFMQVSENARGVWNDRRVSVALR